MSEPTNPKSGEKRKPDDIRQNKHREDKEKIKRRFFLSPKIFAKREKRKGRLTACPDGHAYKQRTPETNLRGSESGGYLLSHDATQYHRRCWVCGRLCRLSPTPLCARSVSRPAPSAALAGLVTRLLPHHGTKRYGLSPFFRIKVESNENLSRRRPLFPLNGTTLRGFPFSSTSERGSHKKKSIKILTPIYKTRGGVRVRAHNAREKVLVGVG